MKGTVLILSGVMAAAAPGMAQDASKPAQEAKPAGQAQPAPSPAPAEAPSAANARAGAQVSEAAKRPSKNFRWFIGEFQALDLDKKTLSFQTDDGKRYTVEAQVPTRQDTMDRAAKLAEILKPGDKIRMLCHVNEKEEPTLILSLHMVGDAAPMQYR